MKSIYKRSIGVFIVLVIFLFLGKMFYQEWNKISEYNWNPRIPWFLLSMMVLFVVYFMAAYGWLLIIKMMGVRIGLGRGLSIYLLSLVGRYIPGGVWSVLGRIYLCSLEGIPDSRSGMSTLLEQAYPVVSAGLVFAASILLWNDTVPAARVLPLIILLPLFFVFLHPKPFLKVMNPILSYMGKEPVNVTLYFNDILKLTGYYIFYWLIAGTAFYFFICSFYPLEVHFILILSGIYAISFTAGYLTFFTPAGLGVREGSLALLLSLFIPPPIAIAISLLSRLWLIAVELVILVVFLINTENRRMVRSALGWQ